MLWGLGEQLLTPIPIVVLRSSLRETVWGRGIQEVKSFAIESC